MVHESVLLNCIKYNSITNYIIHNSILHNVYKHMFDFKDNKKHQIIEYNSIAYN